MADLLYLNASYLSQLIRQKTSKTFSDLLNDARMKQAALLLKNPEAKIYHISTQIGYVNPNNFARAFKAYWGGDSYRIQKPWKIKKHLNCEKNTIPPPFI